jgi:acyl carrier protein
MTREEFLASLDDLVELPAGTLKGPEKLEEVEGWNSMAMIGFIALADQNGVKVAPRQIAASNTIDELLQLAKIEA